ncbi:hypothetical protein [Marinicrinis sediminis]|uniref:Uncharacterized protein n=1 Tax=Marinicrinis sediminis TaxID=1652465 RepID=A0ABW5R9Y5_9BACL
MADWPDWFKEALIQRVDELVVISEKQQDVHIAKMKAFGHTEQLKEQLWISAFTKILEWDEG